MTKDDVFDLRIEMSSFDNKSSVAEYKLVCSSLYNQLKLKIWNQITEVADLLHKNCLV